MDNIGRLKDRMSEAIVEGIFKRARYTVARVAGETQVSALRRTGHGVPDFVIWKADPSLGHRPYRLFAVEVRYCPRLEEHRRREAPARSPEVTRQWPDLYEILVTDRPESGRSCFQAIRVSPAAPAGLPDALDLHLVPGLDIPRRSIDEYEGLVREVFPVIGSRNGGGEWARKLGPRTGATRGGAGRRPLRSVGDHRSRRPALHEQWQGSE